MKAITLKMPWNFAVAWCGKDVENRDWDDRLAELLGLPSLIGQQIAIHGGAAPKRGKNKGWFYLMDSLSAIHHVLDGELPEAAARFLAQRMTGTALTAEDFIVPGVVAVATLRRATRSSPSRWAIPGDLHLELSNIIALPEPVLCRGAQGFWDLTPVVFEAVAAQVRQVEARMPPPTTQQLQERFGL